MTLKDLILDIHMMSPDDALDTGVKLIEQHIANEYPRIEKFIRFDDGTEYRLPDIAYEEWEISNVWRGCTDTSYREYCLAHDMHPINSFDPAEVVLSVVVFKVNGKEVKDMIELGVDL